MDTYEYLEESKSILHINKEKLDHFMDRKIRLKSNTFDCSYQLRYGYLYQNDQLYFEIWIRKSFAC